MRFSAISEKNRDKITIICLNFNGILLNELMVLYLH